MHRTAGEPQDIERAMTFACAGRNAGNGVRQTAEQAMFGGVQGGDNAVAAFAAALAAMGLKGYALGAGGRRATGVMLEMLDVANERRRTSRAT
jgi:queuine/archaeosine tRNA-ribosyltransferase